MYRCKFYGAMLLAILALTSVAGCQSTGGKPSASTAPASGGHCSSCR